MSCSLQCDDPSQDEQEHLLLCQKILAQLENKDVMAAQMIEYSFIFGTPEQQKEAVRIFTRLHDVIEGLLQGDTTPTNGTTLTPSPVRAGIEIYTKSLHYVKYIITRTV